MWTRAICVQHVTFSMHFTLMPNTTWHHQFAHVKNSIRKIVLNVDQPRRIIKLRGGE